MQIQIQNKKLVKTTKRKRNRQYRTDEQTREYKYKYTKHFKQFNLTSTANNVRV